MKMTNKWLAVAGAVAAMGLVSKVQAIPSNPFNAGNANVEFGVSTLGSGAPSTLGDVVTVFWGVNLNLGVYSYSYQIYDTSASDTVDVLTVGFNTIAPGALTVGGNYTYTTPGGVTWVGFTPVDIGGTSGILSFNSLLAPVLGNATATDSTSPPSPWASIFPDGQQVPVPLVPDGGATVMLLGAALSTLGLLRRKLIA